MIKNEVFNYFENKISENKSVIRITFYEIRVKYNLTEDETQDFLQFAKNKFEDMGYNVYFTDSKYTYKGTRRIVQTNELMIAIKE